MSERPGRSNPRGEHAVGWAAAASDDRSHIGYITHFSLDYKMRLIYRFPILTRRGVQPISRAAPRGGWVGCLTSVEAQTRRRQSASPCVSRDVRVARVRWPALLVR